MNTAKQNIATPGNLLRSALASAILVLLLMCPARAQVITVVDPGFDTGGGQIAGQLTLLGGSTAVGPQQIGTSGWYGLANATTATVVVPVAGFRPGITVDAGTYANVGDINYALGASLGGLVGLEMPEADLWQPLAGVSLQANKTYTFAIDVNAGSLLDVTALASRGFGIGVTTGASTTSIGTMYADSLSNPALVNVSLLSGTNQRETLTFTTGSTVPTGDLGLVIFGGRGTQAISLSLLTDFQVDNASLTVVPEPRAAALAGLGLMVVMYRRIFRAGRTSRGEITK